MALHGRRWERRCESGHKNCKEFNHAPTHVDFAFRLVDVLASGSGGSSEFDLKKFLIDELLDRIFRQDSDRVSVMQA
jgi:hypothetical protein